MEFDRKQRKSLLQTFSQAVRHRGVQGNPEQALAMLERILPYCGERSQNKRMAAKIGLVLLEHPRPKVIVPCCPDYSHNGAKYTFQTLSGDVSLLAQKHIEFLKVLQDVHGNLDIVFAVADHEADDALLCSCVHKSKAEFNELVQSTITKTHTHIAPLGWSACAMTTLIPDLVKQEKEVAAKIKSDDSMKACIERETYHRTKMYAQIGCYRQEECIERTIITAAQYIAMGRFIAKHGYMVCNHSTVNLMWYPQTNAALLHNPVEIY